MYYNELKSLKIRMITIFSILMMGLISCSAPDTSAVFDEHCDNLNALVFSIRKIDKSMQQQKSWDEIEVEINKVLTLLSEDTVHECSFRNHEHYPRVMRFLFVDQMCRQLQYNRYPESFPYLIELGKLFKDDNEIREYFGEKLALIAYHNPEVWISYYMRRPMESDSLYRNTRWEITDKDRLIRRLKTTQGASDLIQKLKSDTQIIQK
jgi:hypothetical protein